MYDLQIIRVHQDPTRYRYNYVSGKQVVQQRKTRAGVDRGGGREKKLVQQVSTNFDLPNSSRPLDRSLQHPSTSTMSLVDVQQRQLQSRVSAEDALAGLSGQMMLVSETIGDLRCSADGRCPPNVVDGVARLHVQIEEALRRVATMNETMGALQDQASSVQQILETVRAGLSLQGSQRPDGACAGPCLPQDRTGASSAAAVISPVNARSDSREHPAPEVLSPDEVRLRILGRGEKQQQVGGQPNTTEQQRQERPKSFRELIRERRERNEADSGPPTSETDGSRSIETLEDLVASLSHCLTGGQASAAAEYTTWLGDSLGVETVEDLAERVESSPGLLVAGNGTVGMWRKKEFCDAVRDVAARMRRR